MFNTPFCCAGRGCAMIPMLDMDIIPEGWQIWATQHEPPYWYRFQPNRPKPPNKSQTASTLFNLDGRLLDLISFLFLTCLDFKIVRRWHGYHLNHVLCNIPRLTMFSSSNIDSSSSRYCRVNNANHHCFLAIHCLTQHSKAFASDHCSKASSWMPM